MKRKTIYMAALCGVFSVMLTAHASAAQIERLTESSDYDAVVSQAGQEIVEEINDLGTADCRAIRSRTRDAILV